MKKSKKSLLLMAAIVLSILIGCFGCQDTKREFKDFQSNLGLMRRTVTVYAEDGTPIRSWTGNFDIDNNENRILFDLDGKRIIIRGGIVIMEEE